MIETLTVELEAGRFKSGAAFGVARNSEEDAMAKAFSKIWLRMGEGRVE